MGGNKSLGVMEVGWDELIKHSGLVDKVPERYFTAEEIAKEKGFSVSAIEKKMKKLRKEGKIAFVRVAENGVGKYYYKK